MTMKLEAIRKKYFLTVDELSIAVKKLFRRKLRITKNKKGILLEDLRLYILANDKKGVVRDYYNCHLLPKERKVLNRYDNELEQKILSVPETKELVRELKSNMLQKVEDL